RSARGRGRRAHLRGAARDHLRVRERRRGPPDLGARSRVVRTLDAIGSESVFTGLIADRGTLTALEFGGGGAMLTVSTHLAGELGEGDSIAVNGVCLTATEVGPSSFKAEAMIETLERSSLGELEPGAELNLELPLRAGDRLGGHLVQGHIDGTVTVTATREEGFARVIEIETAPRLARYLVEK